MSHHLTQDDENILTNSVDINALETRMTAVENSITTNFNTNVSQNTTLAGLETTNNTQQTAINLNTAKASMVLGTTAGTALAGNTATGIIKHLLYIERASPNYFAIGAGQLQNAITGSELVAPVELTTSPMRLVIDDLGVVQDTESPNNFSFTESGTMITFGWTQQVVLIFYKFEYYDNSAGERLITFGLYDDHHNTTKFSVRHSINMPTSNTTFKQVSGYAGHIAIQSYAKYFLWAKSSGGGKIQGLEFIFVRSGLNF